MMNIVLSGSEGNIDSISSTKLSFVHYKQLLNVKKKPIDMAIQRQSMERDYIFIQFTKKYQLTLFSMYVTK